MTDTRTAMLRLSALVGERTLFENDAYRKLWFARLLSHTPINAMVYTMLILVVEATGLTFSSSLFVVAYIAPSALLGTISGVMVDRMPKGMLLAGACAIRAMLCVLLAISTDSVWVIYLIAVAFAASSQFSGPAEAAALPSVVEAEDLTAANSLNNLGGLISQIAGLMILPAIFLKTIGAEALALVCAGLFVAAAFNFILIEGLGGTVGSMSTSIEDARERFAEAWHRLCADSISYLANVIVILANTTGLIIVTLLPRFANQVLHVDTENAVFVVTPAALGIWLGLRFVRRVSGRFSAWRSIAVPFTGLVVGVVLLAFVPMFGSMLESWNPLSIFNPGPFGEGSARIMVAMLLSAWLAFTFTLVNVIGRSIVNERIPPEIQGRVFAGQSVLTNLASIPPILLTGLLADIAGVGFVFVLVGVGSGLLAVFFSARNLATPQRAAY